MGAGDPRGSDRGSGGRAGSATAPSGPPAEGPQLVGQLVWEGAVYGIAEALLLATLPVLAVWQAADALGWTDGAWGKIASEALAIVGALLVIAVHHLGYREFRGRGATKKLMGALVACGVQALAFLLTGNVLAPVVAHIVLHGQLILRGVEMPPASDTGSVTPSADRLRLIETESREEHLAASR